MPMIDLQCYQNHFNDTFAKQLSNTLDNKHILTKVIRYAALAKGKRLRPILLYLSAQTFNQQLPLKTLDNPACALEAIHIYSLIHDDLPAIDNDDMRHHQPSCHIRYGEDMAILAGDALQSLAFLWLGTDVHLNNKKHRQLTKLLSQYALQMVIGQTFDLTADQYVNADYLQKMYTLKTGALLSVAVLMGATLAEAEEEALKKLTQFAEAFGLAYQIQDDILDVLSPSRLLGKNQGSDIKRSQPTYVSLFGVDGAKKTSEQYYEAAITHLSQLQIKNNQLIKLTEYLKERKF